MPEINPAPAESAEMVAMKAQLAKFQDEAVARDGTAKKEAAEKAAQQAKINGLTKALAMKQYNRTNSATGIPPALTGTVKKKTGRPPASIYGEQAHVLTEQDKRARVVTNNTDYMKAGKAWTQRYMKKQGKVGAIPSDDAALNAEREPSSQVVEGADQACSGC